MRDGEQSPGCSMNLEEKLRVARMLEGMGVDVIEARFAIASPGDFEAVNEIAKALKDTVVCSLARSSNMDIDAAAEALKPAVRKRIHTFISTSPLHMSVKLQMSPEEVHQAVVKRWVSGLYSKTEMCYMRLYSCTSEVTTML